MSVKTRVVKTAIKMTPNKIVIWVANIILKGIAKLSEFKFDLDSRTAYVQVTLYGESEPIDVWLDGFAVLTEEDAYYLVIQQAKSNRPWMDNLLARITGKAWKIPVIPKYKKHLEFLAELFKPVEHAEEQETI
jgi:hypothetical protein